MIAYMEEVKNEHARISEFFSDTIKELRDSFKMLESHDYVTMVQVGSLETGTPYSVSCQYHCLDIMIWNTEYKDQAAF